MQTVEGRLRIAMSILRSLLPSGVRVAQTDPRTVDAATLHPAEREFVAFAVERRRREFAAGRLLARRFLRSKGYDGALRRLPDGSPDWPPGIVGSITHCDTLVAVAIGNDRDCAAIGIDVEADRPLHEGVPELVLADEELRRLRARPECGDRAVLRIFCAKEALYKAIFPISRRPPAFKEMIVEPSQRGESFIARLAVAYPPFFAKDSVVQGRWRTQGEHVAAAVVIEPWFARG
jgi:4'-phosphopantetheinyl transferase EntD